MLGIFRLLAPALGPTGETCSNMRAPSSCQDSLVDTETNKPAPRDDSPHYFDLEVLSPTASQSECASTLDS